MQQEIEQNIRDMFAARGDPGVSITIASRDDMMITEQNAVFFFHSGVSIREARELTAHVEETRPMTVIVSGNITCQAKQILHDICVRLFKLEEFHFNPTKHEYVPKHVKLSSRQKECLSKQVRLQDLPRIHIDDVISRYYGVVAGDVFRIERPTGIYYRLVSSEG